MEHKPISGLSDIAGLVPETQKKSLTRRERVERWIEVLNRDPGRALKTLQAIEHKPRDARRASRVDDFYLSVAFDGPILRADHLHGRTPRRMSATTLSFRMEAHRACCSCSYGESMNGRSGQAGRLRSVAEASDRRSPRYLGSGRRDRGGPVPRPPACSEGPRGSLFEFNRNSPLTSPVEGRGFLSLIDRPRHENHRCAPCAHAGQCVSPRSGCRN